MKPERLFQQDRFAGGVIATRILRDPVHLLGGVLGGALFFGQRPMPRATPGNPGAVWRPFPIWYTFSWLPQPIYWALWLWRLLWSGGCAEKRAPRPESARSTGGKMSGTKVCGQCWNLPWVCVPDHIVGRNYLRFVMFRLFDIIKPWAPLIGWTSAAWGFGIMVDGRSGRHKAWFAFYLNDLMDYAAGFFS